MENNINEFNQVKLNIQNEKNKKNKKLGLVIMLTSAFFLLVGIFLLYNNIKHKNNSDNDNDNEIIEEKNQLWDDFNNGLIDADEYVRYNIYNVYDISLLDKKYILTTDLNIDSLVNKYYNELSEETLKLYVDYLSLSNLTFKTNDDKTIAKQLKNTKKEKPTINLDNVYLSSEGNFLFWYTDSGNGAVDLSSVQKYAELLENFVLQYKNIMGLEYDFKSSIVSKGKRYKEQLEILNNSNIDEKHLTESMHVYIYDFNNPEERGMYSSVDVLNNELLKFIDNYLNNEDGTIITPYISLNSFWINNKTANFENTIAHELFHHYQTFIINNSTGTRNIVTDLIIEEATAQWAAAKLAKNELKNSSLNTMVSNYIKHTDDILTEMYNIKGTEVAYTLFRFLYSYENNVSNGIEKILKSIHSDDGFKYLNDNATIHEKNKVMIDLALKNLNNEYPNNNYLPMENDVLKIKKEFTNDSSYSENVNLSPLGIDYYSFDYNIKNKYEINLNIPNSQFISAYVIGGKEHKYEILTSELNIENNILIDTENYKNYEKLYFVITNNDFKNAYNYNIEIKSSKLDESNKSENKITFKTKFNNYKIKALSTVVMYGMETISVINGVVDELHQKEYLETTTQVMGFNVSTSTYVDFAKGYTYVQNPLTGIWEKSQGATTFIDLSIILDKFKENGSFTKVNSEQYLVKLTKNDIKGLLKYNNNLNQYSFEGDIFVTVYLKDNYVSKLEYDFSTLIKEVEKFTMVIEFYDHNKAGDVSIPAEVIG